MRTTEIREQTVYSARRTAPTATTAGLRQSGSSRVWPQALPARAWVLLLLGVVLPVTTRGLPTTSIHYDTLLSGENLQSAYLLRTRRVQPWGSGPRPSLQAHFGEVLTILEHKTERSLSVALDRLESSRAAAWTAQVQAGWRQRLATARQRNISVLREYRARGLFPVNDVDPLQSIPIFVDHQDTACAVGYLMRRSGAEESVDAIAKANNFVYVTDVQDGPLVDWILTSGLTQEEAALIQPGYPSPHSFAAAVQPDGEYLVITDPIGVFEPEDEPPDDPDSYDWGTVHYAYKIARLNPDGSFDKSLDQGALNRSGDLFTVAVQPDGKILAGGWFTELNGEPRAGLVRLNEDFSVDPGFDAGIDSGNVAHLALQPDGKIVVAGNYLVIAGEPQSQIARFNPDGSLDGEFSPMMEGLWVNALALQSDGKILVGGAFNAVDGQPREGLARLNRDGTLDPGFVFNMDYVSCIAVQPDGKILVGGNAAIHRLNADGSPDEEFTPPAHGAWALAIQADGRILWGARSDYDRNFGRLLADGSRDPTLSARVGDIYGITLVPHGEVLLTGHVSGDFRVQHITNTQPATEQLSYDGSAITWMRGGSAPAFWRTTFEVSTNGLDWVLLGTGEHVEGGWVLDTPDLADEVVIRARGSIAGSDLGSGGILQSYWSLDLLNAPKVVLMNPKHRVTDQRFDFSIAATPRQKLVVETSTNHVDWTAVATYCYDETPVRVKGAKSTEHPLHFYRVRTQP